MQKNVNMKQFIYSLTAVCLIITTFSCKKYDSQIKGKVSYIAIDTQKEAVAAGAILEKIQIIKDKENKIATVRSDSNGFFVFNYVTDGKWKIKGQLTIDSIVYESYSNIISTSGEDSKEVNLLLDSVYIITNE